jgi:putative transposase
MSETYQSLSHSKWDCKYHVVFVPKRRRKAIFGQTRRQLGAIFHALARSRRIPPGKRRSMKARSSPLS